MRRTVAILLLPLIAGCGDYYRNHTECRKVADLIDDLQQQKLRAYSEMEDLSKHETLLMTIALADPPNAYSRCMEFNR